MGPRPVSVESIVERSMGPRPVSVESIVERSMGPRPVTSAISGREIDRYGIHGPGGHATYCHESPSLLLAIED